MAKIETEVKAATTPAANRLFLLASLSIGHGIIHWYQQSFFVILPEIKQALQLGAVEVGALQTVRSIAGGAVNFPAGFITDMLRRRWSVILAVSMAWIGTAYFLVGIAPSYALLLPAMALVGMGGAIWHPPAISSLAQRFASRRGLALSLHGVGGSAGDTLAPLAIGALLLTFSWRGILHIYIVPALLLALLVWIALRGVYGQETSSTSVRAYIGSLGKLLKNKVILGLLIAGGVRGMGQNALFTFMPIYFREDLQFSTAKVGFYLSLLTFMGMGSQPTLGFLSDRLGRKAVLVPCLIVLGLLQFALTFSGTGAGLVAVIVGMGLFVYALQAIVVATAMDVAGRQVGATTVGLMFGGSFLFTAISPIIGGALVNAYGIEAVFVYSGALVAASALVILVLPIAKTKTS